MGRDEDNGTHGHGRALPGSGVLFSGQASPWGSARQCQNCAEHEREGSGSFSCLPREPSS